MFASHQPTVVLISGYARAGKDTLAKEICRITGGKRLAFADQLKDTCNLMLEKYGLCSQVDFHNENDKVKYRKVLIAVGKALRSIDLGIFARPVAKEARWNLAAGRVVVVSDWRYTNEREIIEAHVAPWRVITVEVAREGTLPADEEEQVNQGDIRNAGLDYMQYFNPGDISGIHDLAQDICDNIGPFVHRA